MKKIKIIVSLISVFLIIVSCNKEEVQGVKEEKTEEHEENENLVTLTETQVKSLKLEFGKVEMKQLTQTIKANGFLKVPNQNKAEVTSMYSGQVKSIYVQPGDFVKSGQAIALLENPNQVLVQEQYLNVMNQIKLSETEVKRQKELYEGNAGALKNLQYAETQLKSLQTQRASLVKQLQMMGINPGSVSSKKLSSYMTIKSPISGVVGNVLVDIGTYVDITTPIAQIVDNSNLHLDLDIFERDLPKVKKGQIIHFTITNNPEKDYDAEIFSIGSTFEDQSKAIPVHAKVKGDKIGLIDGMNVVAIIGIGESSVQAVISESLVNVGAENFIFIQREEPHKHEEGEKEYEFEKIPVGKGVTEVGYTEIIPLKPIPDNVRVVTKGAFFLLAKLNSTGEEGHAH